MYKPFNFATGNYYRGKNSDRLLDCWERNFAGATYLPNGREDDYPAYATFIQIKNLGGKVIKGEKSVGKVHHFKEQSNSGLNSWSNVFHISQCDFGKTHEKRRDIMKSILCFLK